MSLSAPTLDTDALSNVYLPTKNPPQKQMLGTFVKSFWNKEFLTNRLWFLSNCLYLGESLQTYQKQKVKVKSLSCVRLFATPWAVAYQAPPSMGFSRQESWSGLPFPPETKATGK